MPQAASGPGRDPAAPWAAGGVLSPGGAAGVLDEAREAGTAVLPFCPFVNGYISRHREYVELVPEEFRTEFGL